MRTSIKSKLFLFAYGTVLFLILGIIVLNNTYLERYYINYRQKSLVEAFAEIKGLNLNEAELENSVFAIEESFSIDVNILKEFNPPQFTPEDREIYQWIYGGQRPHDEIVFSAIISEYRNQREGTAESLVKPVDLDDPQYLGYMMEIATRPMPGGSENSSMFSFCIAPTNTEAETTYYILTITIASVKGNIAVFNTFTIIVGFVFMIVSGLVMYFISYSFTSPIMQISQVAENIAALNFENKVKVKTNDELGDLGSSINRMSTQLENAINELKAANLKLSADIEMKDKVDAMRREFIANASHELKTPLALIMGYCEAMMLPGLSKTTSDEYLGIIMDESHRMDRLVKALLEISQLESGIMEIQNREFSIREFVEDTIKLFTIMFEEAKVRPEIDLIDAVVVTDFDHLQTVMSNFLANAIHHVNGEKIIRISANVIAEKRLKVAVYNSGDNIPEAEIDRIWESFYKLDKARTREYGGHGLGLSIARTILGNLGLTYGAINHEKGVEFFFELPLTDNEQF